jgi:hypothetical protein
MRRPMTSVQVLVAIGVAATAAAQPPTPGKWVHLSSKRSELPPPNPGRQQTSATVFDIDRDGVHDFVITERTAAPAVVWYRRGARGWRRYVIEAAHLRPEAGATFADIDGDGDLDFVAGGDGSSNEVWWWENPAPDFDPEVAWKRRFIKNLGGRKHHDLMFVDADGDGRQELVFWNQGDQRLLRAPIPAEPRRTEPWPYQEIYRYSSDSEPVPLGQPAAFRTINEHEGLAQADIDGDGKLDIIGGGRWFKHLEGDRFLVNLIDPAYAFSRTAAGDLIEGGRPEVVLVAGDGVGPLRLYEWVKGTWRPATLIARVENGHSLAVADVDGDGRLDIFCAEMRLNGANPEAHAWVLLGDGRGGFRLTVLAQGYGMHEAKLADLDGNGTLDVLAKPYNWETPRLDIWLNFGAGR